MTQNKSFKLGYALIVSLACGLSSCMYDEGYQSHTSQDSATYQHGATEQAKVTKAAAKSDGIAREPVQKATPGPKRAAAPQIPVIQ